MKKLLRSALIITIATLSLTGTSSYAAFAASKGKTSTVTQEASHLETIRKNAAIFMNKELANKHQTAKNSVKSAMRMLHKEDKNSWELINPNVIIILNTKSPNRQAAYDQLQLTIAEIFNGITAEQIEKVNRESAALAEKQKRFEVALTSMQEAVAAGEMTAEQAAEKAEQMSNEIAQDQQKVLESSSRLSQFGAYLASPFQWIGSKVFDEETSNLKRAVYTVGATAGVIALGAAAYYYGVPAIQNYFGGKEPSMFEKQGNLAEIKTEYSTTAEDREALEKAGKSFLGSEFVVNTLGDTEIPEPRIPAEGLPVIREAAKSAAISPLVTKTFGRKPLPEYPSRQESKELSDALRAAENPLRRKTPEELNEAIRNQQKQFGTYKQQPRSHLSKRNTTE